MAGKLKLDYLQPTAVDMAKAQTLIRMANGDINLMIKYARAHVTYMRKYNQPLRRAEALKQLGAPKEVREIFQQKALELCELFDVDISILHKIIS